MIRNNKLSTCKTQTLVLVFLVICVLNGGAISDGMANQALAGQESYKPMLPNVPQGDKIINLNIENEWEADNEEVTESEDQRRKEIRKGHSTVAEPPFVIGVCTHFGQGKGLLSANMSLMRQSGAGSFRDEVYWAGIEDEKGKLHMPKAWERYVQVGAEQGLEPLLILDYGNPLYDEGNKPASEEALAGFVRYSEFVARHFRHRVDMYEVWNEYDIGIGTPNDEGGTPEEYVQLLKRVYPAVKEVDSSATVLAGAATPMGVRGGWLEEMMKEGALQYADAISIHTYNYGREGRQGTPEGWARWMHKVGHMLSTYNGGERVPVYVTEMGWPTHEGERGTPPHLAAAYLARLYLLARTMPFMKGLWWYDFQDDGWEATHNEHNFGVVRPDLTPKPAYHALQDIAEIVTTARYLGRIETRDEGLYILKFQRPDGRQTWAFWSTDEERDHQVVLRHPASDMQRRLTMHEVGDEPIRRFWGYRPWVEENDATVRSNEFSLVVTQMPTLLTGKMTDVTIEKVRKRQ